LEKEQKPNIELIQRSWYMEGYNDRKFGKEPKWVIKTGNGGPKYEENPKYGQMLDDEQKPAISREEILYQLFQNGSIKLSDYLYLTGEQKPAEVDLDEAAEKFAHQYDMGTCDGIAQDCFKAGAEWMEGQVPLPEDTVIFQKGVEEGKRLMMEDALDGVAHPDDCEIWVNLVGYGYDDIKDGDKVKVIIVEEEEQ
jgi:hypothetical protein